MAEILYTIIIYPLEQIIGLCFLFVYRIFSDPGVALCGVSIAVSVLTLPLYFAAEKWQIIERETVRRLSPKIARIKQAFSGDEQYLILSTYYRQNHYHPFYALRSTFGLLVQAPFFIAAYLFISNLAVLQGCSFLFIRDLSAPDGLFKFGTHDFRVNILPILMTLINWVAGAVYTKGFPLREKIQLYGIAAIFLVLLYNSPSALVLYWTLNNVFSLIKNILQKTPCGRKIVFIGLCVFAVLLNGYLLFFHQGALSKRLVICFAVIAVCVLWAQEKKILSRFDVLFADLLDNSRYRLIIFLLVSFNLFLLSGAVIPSSLIASSPQEFSFIEPYEAPFPVAVPAVLQAVGVFLFLPVCLYALLSRRIKTLITLFLAVLLSVAVVNTFAMPGNYGAISNILTFENPALIIPHGNFKIISIIVFFILTVITLILFSSILKIPLKVLSQCYAVLIAVFGIFSAYNAYGIQSAYASYAAREQQEGTVFSAMNNGWGGGLVFSETGKNVLIIMLDRAVSGYVPFIFAEKPDLYDTFSGFTWYPNTVSFGGYTLTGTPPLYGGYEYTPGKMQEKNSEPLVAKHNEALLMLPRIFSENGWEASVMDPPWANYSWVPDISIFTPYPNIRAGNIIGERTTSLWEKNSDGSQADFKIIDIGGELRQKMLRFSLFKCVPAFLRYFLYDNGDWLLPVLENETQISRTLINEYAALSILPEITMVTKENKNTFISMSSGLTHTPEFLQLPNYTLAEHVTDKGHGQFSDNPHYHVDTAAFLLLQKWFLFLKENNVYDNTRIIIVSDHGSNISDLPNNITLPNGAPLASYTALLMVKDFDEQGRLKTDSTFMTNADMPSLAVSNLIENPVNPFSGQLIDPDKENGIVIVTSHRWAPKDHFKNNFNIGKNEWLFVKDDIFKADNWQAMEIAP
jgi:YidC/Oxa1 family membrane protein insertase